ncbi:tetraspanin-9-like [Amphibalanus amphitrite]|uniref:tetraspanin-9-like n=1 Tax=Amphibalanus amphitrite TaxID=1232801 RepID=UPI001C91E9A8|nr:tetraspanin-9-like [Amphibalanus amphitrite]
MNASLEQYRNNSSTARDWDHVQRALRCCGPTGAADWAPVLGNGTVPDSCCERAAAANCSGAEGSFSAGCAPAVQALVAGQRRWSVALATATASLLLLLIIVMLSGAVCDGDVESQAPLIVRVRRDIPVNFTMRDAMFV